MKVTRSGLARSLTALLFIVAMACSLQATSSRQIRLNCPVCQTDISARELMSSNTFGGVDTDFMSHAQGSSVLQIRPVTCLNCYFSGFVGAFNRYSEPPAQEWDEEPVTTPPALIASVTFPATFTAAIKIDRVLKPVISIASYTDQSEIPAWVRYDLIAQVYRLTGQPPRDLADLYLQASWSVRDEDNVIQMLSKSDTELIGDFFKNKIRERFKDSSPNQATAEVGLAYDLLKETGSEKAEEIKASLMAALLFARRHGENQLVLDILARLLPLMEKAVGTALQEHLNASIAREREFQKLAIDHFTLCLAEKNDTDLESRLIYLIGELNRRMGNFDQARTWFEKVRAIKDRPKFVDQILSEVEPRLPLR